MSSAKHLRRCTLGIALFAMSLVGGRATPAISDANLLANPGFEQPIAEDWKLFVPPESQTAHCTLQVESTDVHAGRQACLLASQSAARFGLLPRAPMIRVRTGERYRLSAWIKANVAFQAEPGTPGIVLRATLLATPNQDAPGGHWYIGLHGVAHEPSAKLADGKIPAEWTRIEGVIDIPAGARYLAFFIFVWKGSGRILVDDAELAAVPKSVALTPAR